MDIEQIVNQVPVDIRTRTRERIELLMKDYGNKAHHVQVLLGYMKDDVTAGIAVFEEYHAHHPQMHDEPKYELCSFLHQLYKRVGVQLISEDACFHPPK